MRLTLYTVLALLSFIITILQLPKIFTKQINYTSLAIAFLSFFVLVFSVIQEYKNEKDSTNDKHEIINNNNQNTEKIINVLDDDPSKLAKDGFSIYLVISTTSSSEKRRKFIVDLGQDTNKYRMSIYQDYEDNLIFRIIDGVGESFTLKVPSTSYTFNANTKFLLYCDCGISNNLSYMRMRVNDKLIGETSFKVKINLVGNIFLDPMKMFLGADMSGNNGGSFSISEEVIWQRALNSHEINTIWESVASYYLTPQKENKLFILEEIPNAYAAYSFRRIKKDDTEPCAKTIDENGNPKDIYPKD
ncbi:MAG: hypothetical protein JST70_18560 [Bacteroidetes bacterium]|nr:hypothetical protein [Bacteroidota bacterium]